MWGRPEHEPDFFKGSRLKNVLKNHSFNKDTNTPSATRLLSLILTHLWEKGKENRILYFSQRLYELQRKQEMV